MKEHVSETDWHVITGSLSCGKTAVVNWFAFHNYHVIPEAARLIIDQGISEGRTIQEIRGDNTKFQNEVLDKKVSAELRIPTNQLTIFDRGIPDTEAYWRMSGIENNLEYLVKVCKGYKNIFLLDRLPRLTEDYARTEDEQYAERLHHELRRVYQELGYNVIAVPVLPVDKRAQFILDII